MNVTTKCRWFLSSDGVHYSVDYDVYRFEKPKKYDDGILRNVDPDITQAEAEAAIRSHYANVIKPSVTFEELRVIYDTMTFVHEGNVLWKD